MCFYCLMGKSKQKSLWKLNLNWFLICCSFCVTASHVAFSLPWTQPDLLNFKKGWMTKLYEDGMVLVFIFSLLSNMIEMCFILRNKTNGSSLSSVEETLVRPDRSEFKVLQGLHCWGGKILHTKGRKILAAAVVVVVVVITDWSVLTLTLFSPSGVRTGRWGWPLHMLRCQRVPGPEELRLPNPGECGLFLSAFPRRDVLFRLEEPWPINSLGHQVGQLEVSHFPISLPETLLCLLWWMSHDLSTPCKGWHHRSLNVLQLLPAVHVSLQPCALRAGQCVCLTFRFMFAKTRQRFQNIVALHCWELQTLCFRRFSAGSF